MGVYGIGYRDIFWNILSGESMPGAGWKRVDSVIESVIECMDGIRWRL